MVLPFRQTNDFASQGSVALRCSAHFQQELGLKSYGPTHRRLGWSKIFCFSVETYGSLPDMLPSTLGPIVWTDVLQNFSAWRDPFVQKIEQQ